MTEPFIPIGDAAKPVLTRLALLELDVCIERLSALRTLLARQFAPPEQDNPTRTTKDSNQ